MAAETDAAIDRVIPSKSLMIAALILLGLATGGGATAAASSDATRGAGWEESYECTGDGAYLYKDINYSGASSTFTADDPWLGDDAIGNDRADSIHMRAVFFPLLRRDHRRRQTHHLSH